VLRYQVAGKAPKSAIFASRDSRGGYFTLMLVPPKELSDVSRQPLEMVFTLDTSGSMEGIPLEQSKAAMRYALSHMNEQDSFQIINFSDHPVDSRRARWPRRLVTSRPPSSIFNACALAGAPCWSMACGQPAFPARSEQVRFVSFLTDGYIGNEAEAFREIHNSLGPARIFSFGVGRRRIDF